MRMTDECGVRQAHCLTDMKLPPLITRAGFGGASGNDDSRPSKGDDGGGMYAVDHLRVLFSCRVDGIGRLWVDGGEQDHGPGAANFSTHTRQGEHTSRYALPHTGRQRNNHIALLHRGNAILSCGLLRSPAASQNE